MREKTATHIFAQERRNQIAEYVATKQRVTVDELCETFQVSPATMRSDLNFLHEAGQLQRTHGGAIANYKVGYELFSAEKGKMNLPQKQAIAREAVKLIHEGDCIALDSGTTVLELAMLLENFKNLHVVTWDLAIAGWLDSHTELSIFMVGGEVRKGHHYTTGYTFREYLPKLNVDTFFMSANGIDPQRGITTPQIETAMIKELVLKGSKKAVLLSDSSKMGLVTFARFARLQDVETLITDDGCSEDMKAELERCGPSVKLVPCNI